MNEHTTHIPAIKRLTRSRDDRMLAGVSGGLARYFEIHPAVFRVGFVVLTLLGGAGLVIYAAAWLVMPDEGKEDSVATAALRDRRERPWPLIGLGLLAVAGALVLSRVTLWAHGDAWILFLLAGALILWVTRRSHAPATEASDAAAADTAVTAVPPTRRPRRGVLRVFAWIGVFLAAMLAVALLAVAAIVAVFDVDHSVGDRNYAAHTVQELRDDYRLGVGSMVLDLGSLQLPEGETHVDARVDIGDLDVIVPPDASVRVHGTAEMGYVEVLGRDEDGRNVEVDVSQAGTRILVLDAHVGAGAIEVMRAVR